MVCCYTIAFSGQVQAKVSRVLCYVYTGPVPNISSSKIGPDRPSVYTGPFWNRSGFDPKLDLLLYWIRCRLVPEQSRVNTSGFGSKQFHVNRSRSGPVRFRMVLVWPCVDIAQVHRYSVTLEGGEVPHTPDPPFPTRCQFF